MSESIESTTERYWLLWASLKAIILGVVCFFLALFLSLLITIPWSKHYWAGDGQAVLGGMAVSLIFGIASAIAAAIYMLRRTIQGIKCRVPTRLDEFYKKQLIAPWT